MVYYSIIRLSLMSKQHFTIVVIAVYLCRAANYYAPYGII